MQNTYNSEANVFAPMSKWKTVHITYKPDGVNRKASKAYIKNTDTNAISFQLLTLFRHVYAYIHMETKIVYFMLALFVRVCSLLA